MGNKRFFKIRTDYKKIVNLLTIDVVVHTGGIGLPIKCKAIWDTGSNHTLISDKLIKGYGLKPYSIKPSFCAGSDREEIKDIFRVDLEFPGNHILKDVEIASHIMKFKVILVGMDIISKGTLMIDNSNNRTILTFYYPEED